MQTMWNASNVSNDCIHRVDFLDYFSKEVASY